MMQNGGYSILPASAIYNNCTFSTRNFAQISFVHCPRDSNRVARVLSSHRESSVNIIWESEPPDFLVDAIIHDIL